MDIDGIAHDILKDGLDDWVPIDRLIGYAQQRNPDGYHELVREVLTHLFNEGLTEAGRFGDNGYSPEGASRELLSIVIADCESLGWNPQGGGYWLSNTKEGDRVASAL